MSETPNNASIDDAHRAHAEKILAIVFTRDDGLIDEYVRMSSGCLQNRDGFGVGLIETGNYRSKSPNVYAKDTVNTKQSKVPARYMDGEKLAKARIAKCERLLKDSLSMDKLGWLSLVFYSKLSKNKVAKIVGVHHSTFGRFYEAVLGKLTKVL